MVLIYKDQIFLKNNSLDSIDSCSLNQFVDD